MQYLREHKQMKKIELYHHFSTVLGICLFLSVLATVSKGTALIIQWDDIWWQVWWMWDAYWYSVYYVCLICGIWLWRPLPDNSLYRLTDEMLHSQTIVEDDAPDSSSGGSGGGGADDGDGDDGHLSPVDGIGRDRRRIHHVEEPPPVEYYSEDQTDYSEEEERDVQLQVKIKDEVTDESDPEEVYYYNRPTHVEETETLVQ
eukprot:TRINITY_DN15070_c0_g1_i1.p1 TRINITY_DN15070_c0_g1~~TRINITY_DN15070_c0_g1_i1.p1  ORF type:complete len:201 (+),score=44.83 TRINITY_DN15070_c0_g1_i1:51-653(+)